MKYMHGLLLFFAFKPIFNLYICVVQLTRDDNNLKKIRSQQMINSHTLASQHYGRLIAFTDYCTEDTLYMRI